MNILFNIYCEYISEYIVTSIFLKFRMELFSQYAKQRNMQGNTIYRASIKSLPKAVPCQNRLPVGAFPMSVNLCGCGNSPLLPVGWGGRGLAFKSVVIASARTRRLLRAVGKSGSLQGEREEKGTCLLHCTRWVAEEDVSICFHELHASVPNSQLLIRQLETQQIVLYFLLIINAQTSG